MDLELKDKVAIVGGGSKGLGRACADVLAEEGAKIAVCSRSKADLERAAQAIRNTTGAEVLSLAGDLDELTQTVFCGDTWEMDLAMPYALGAKVHLLDRAAPFETYCYERQAVAAYADRGKTSADLSGLLDWL